MTTVLDGVQHATLTAYRAGCRCKPCDDYRYRYFKQWKRDRERGITRNVDAGPVRDHIEALIASGLTTGNIAVIAGIPSHRQIIAMRDPARRFIRRATAERILAIQPRQLPENADPDCETFVDAEPSRRRIRALLALGWTHDRMWTDYGIRTRVTLHQKSPRVTWRTHVRIRDMYDDLSMTPGPSKRSRDRAQRLGYLPPLAWDDDAIDDVAAWASPGETADDGLVDDVVVERLVAGADWRAVGATRAERIAAAAHMSGQEAERRLGLRPGRDYEPTRRTA